LAFIQRNCNDNNKKYFYVIKKLNSENIQYWVLLGRYTVSTYVDGNKYNLIYILHCRFIIFDALAKVKLKKVPTRVMIFF